MKVRADIICWNEAETLLFTLKHYRQIANHLVVWDHYSTDNSAEIAREFGADVVNFGQEGVLDDRDYLKIKNAELTGQQYDWRIVVDADEILCVNRGRLEYEMEQGTTVLKTLGWNIYSNLMPQTTWAEIDTGFVDTSFSKMVCYNPQQIQSMNYTAGAHFAKPSGRVFYSNATYTLRHYRCVGGVERIIKRHRQYEQRLSHYNKSNKLGWHYLRTEEQIRAEWQRNIERSRSYLDMI